MPGAALILSINELIVCLGIETKAQAVEVEINDNLTFDEYPACRYDIGAKSVLNYVGQHGILTSLNGDLVDVGIREAAPYAFADFSESVDYAPPLLPKTFSCASQIGSADKKFIENTVIIDESSKQLRTGLTNEELQYEVLGNGPAVVLLLTAESIGSLTANDVYVHDINLMENQIALVILGWIDEPGSEGGASAGGEDKRCWVFMNTRKDWGDRNVGLISWKTMQGGQVSGNFTLVTAEAKWGST